jgi:hypothetical protein
MLRITALLALACFATAARAQSAPEAPPRPAPLTLAQKNAIIAAPLPADQAAMKAHVMFLASDAMRGREAGTPEYDIAANYVAAQFYAQGLRPAGDDGGYLQTVPLLGYKAADKGTFVVSRAKAPPLTLAFGDDYFPEANPEKPAMLIEAPVVFVGHGIVAPGLKRDDYAGVDVRGKIAVYFAGTSGNFPDEQRAHFASNASKAEIAARRGAIGVLQIESPLTARYRPFSTEGAAWDHGRTTWANKDGSGHIAAPGTPSLGILSLAGAAKLFAGARQPWSQIVRQAESETPRFRAEQLPGTLAVSLKTELTPIKSYNVAGLIPGSDPAIGKQIVILSAHLDHVGVGAAIDGDAIYNGAEDNAVGIAALIEEARRFQDSGKPPRRSILFLAVTAEEKGLVGADYFAHHPTVPKRDLVADVNLDMPVLTYKFEDIIAYGAENSSLGETARRAAASVGVGIGKDPNPEQGFFVRSDHYRFVQQGIPSLFLWPGQAGPGAAGFAAFLADHYHKPSDELAQQPALDWAQGIRFVDLIYAITREIADADERPRWNQGDFFGSYYEGYGAK